MRASRRALGAAGPAGFESYGRMLAAGAPPADVLDALARGLTSKLLHPSLAALNTAGEAERAELTALFARIYGFPESGPAAES